MNILDNINETSGKIADAGETYVKKTEEYYKLKVFQQISVSISFITRGLIIGGVLFLAIFFLAFSLAFALGQWLENFALGYLIVAGLLIVTTLILYYNRHIINKKIIQALSSKFFDS
jgi:sterol desaturase/sphingolipid hydroxylase (fatty acid hydroxylase superfamily)